MQKTKTFIYGVLVAIIVISCTNKNYKDEVKVRAFIKNNWDSTIRFHPNDSSTLFGLPKPYTVPSISGSFQEMYYWDTYFTNIGLIKDGRIEQAKNNVENMCYLVNRFGFMLNGNRIWFLSNSQPPYLSMMIKSVYDITKDKVWLLKVLPSLTKEYNFWMTNRITPIGLNHYSNQASDSIKISSFYNSGKRLGKNYKPDSSLSINEKIETGSHFYAECESGWDMNPRFDSNCENFCPIDLNCNLFMYERNFEFFAHELNLESSINWDSISKARARLINQYCFNTIDSLFYDYNFIKNTQSKILSAAIFSALWSNLATKVQAEKISRSLSKLEFNFGISACVPGERKYTYQWDYPNGWACLQYLTIAGLENYGYTTDALRIANKYVKAISQNYKNTGNLWEKYNVNDGSINVVNEYKMPTMMGWTAGVYVYATDLIWNSKK